MSSKYEVRLSKAKGVKVFEYSLKFSLKHHLVLDKAQKVVCKGSSK